MDFDSVLLAKYLDKEGGGSSVEVESLSVTENGTYTADEGKAYSPVTVNVGGLTLKGVAEKTEPSGVIDVTGFSLGSSCFTGYNNITRVQGSPIGSNGTGYQSFTDCTGITSVNLTAQTTQTNSFRGCTNLVNAVIITDTANDANTGLFNSCTKLQVADLTIKRLRSNFFYNDNALSTLVLRSATITGLENTSVIGVNAFKNGGTGGEIYIPKSLYDHLGDGSSSDYKSATNWSTIDGYRTITWKQIEGSYYETHYADGTEITA